MINKINNKSKGRGNFYELEFKGLKLKEKSAFTLVELIVVITILTILGVISFMHLQGYSIDTRDVKRITDIKNLLSKVNIEITKGVQLKDLIKDEYQTGITINDNSGAITNIGIINFENLKEDQRSFQDPLNGRDYPFAFAEGATEVDGETENYKFLQMATINERSRTTRLVGYYFQYKPKDSPSLFVNEEGRRMEDNSGPMIYPIEDSSFLTLPIVIPVVGM